MDLWQVLVMNATARGTIELDNGVGAARGVRGSYTYHLGQPDLAAESVNAIIDALRDRYGDALVPYPFHVQHISSLVRTTRFSQFCISFIHLESTCILH